MVLIWIWGGFGRKRFPLRPLLATIALWAGTVTAGILIDQTVRFEAEAIIFALCLFAAAVNVLLWLPAAHRLKRGRPVVNEENLVNVHCPQCGYSLIGLVELRCPECGARFTTDELIRSQNYTGQTTPIPPPIQDGNGSEQASEAHPPRPTGIQ